MPAVDSPILLDFDRCRVLHGETLVADLALVTGTDARLTAARTPTAHAASHRSGGSDAIKLDDLAAPEDNTNLNATSTAHGLLPKLSNDAAQFLNGQGGYTVPAGTYVHPNHTGDVTSVADGAQTIAADAVTNAKLANMAANSIKGNNTGSTADPLDLTAAQARTLLNVADGATANSSDATLLARANHTGTQLAATISDFSTAVAATAAVTANTAKVTNATHTGEVTGATALTITADAVTYAKMQNVSAISRLLGRGSAAGAGDPEEITLGTNLSMSGTTLNAAATFSSVAIAFTDGDTMRRVTVTDAAVGAASKIIGTIRRPDTTDDSADRGYIYLVNVVRVAAGSFDVLLSCLGWGFDDPTELPPSETVQFYYQIAA